MDTYGCILVLVEARTHDRARNPKERRAGAGTVLGKGGD